MGVSPQYVGRYGKPWTITLNTDSGADNITGINAASISVTLRSAGGTDVVSTGAITVVTSNPAVIQWQPTSADYAAAGEFSADVTVTFPTGPVDYDPIPFELKLR